MNTINDFKFDYPMCSEDLKSELNSICSRLIANLQDNIKIGIENRANGDYVEVARYFPQKSKKLLDEIDKILAEHYGFTEEELDFIINYDIKYRMGKALFGEDDEEAEEAN